MKISKYIFRGLVFVLLLLGILYLQTLFSDNESVRATASSGGYFGVFIFSFLNSFNFLVPIVTASLVPTWVSAGLDFFHVVVWIVLATTIVDIGMFVIGRLSGKSILGASKLVARLKEIREKSYVIPLLILALWVIFAPLPNELVTVPMGLLGYRILPVSLIVLLGNLAFTSFVAYESVRFVSG